MIEITKRAPRGTRFDVELVLGFLERQKSRQRVELAPGVEAGIFLPRGETLQDGDCLETSEGEVILVKAASETVTTAWAADPLLFARACYHLGNRHVPLQIADGWVRFLHDHVLESMLREIGLETRVEQAPFEPEGGAYGASGHPHPHPEREASAFGHTHADPAAATPNLANGASE